VCGDGEGGEAGGNFSENQCITEAGCGKGRCLGAAVADQYIILDEVGSRRDFVVFRV
jgi:hypothetical protein